MLAWPRPRREVGGADRRPHVVTARPSLHACFSASRVGSAKRELALIGPTTRGDCFGGVRCSADVRSAAVRPAERPRRRIRRAAARRAQVSKAPCAGPVGSAGNASAALRRLRADPPRSGEDWKERLQLPPRDERFRTEARVRRDGRQV